MPAEKLIDGPKWIIEQALIKLSRNSADSGDGRETDDFVVILKTY